MRKTVTKRLQILSGTHHPQLAAKVARKLGVKPTRVQIEKFANGEIKCRIEESVRGADVYIFQTHSQPINDAIVEQAIMIDAAKRASALRITAICPFLGYSRQDRKASSREPISAKLIIDILATAGADRIVSIDLHSGQIQGFFNGPFDHLTALPVLTNYLKKHFVKDLVIVAPDAGRVKVADRCAIKLQAGLAIVHKKRRGSGQAEALNIIGDVKNQHCVIVDDMIDTASTVVPAAALLKNQGAKTVTVLATHGLFSDPATERLAGSNIDRVIVTDTLPLRLKSARPKIEVVSIADLLASAIKAIFEGSSVSAIFKGDNHI